MVHKDHRHQVISLTVLRRWAMHLRIHITLLGLMIVMAVAEGEVVGDTDKIRMARPKGIIQTNMTIVIVATVTISVAPMNAVEVDETVAEAEAAAAAAAVVVVVMAVMVVMGDMTDQAGETGAAIADTVLMVSTLYLSLHTSHLQLSDGKGKSMSD